VVEVAVAGELPEERINMKVFKNVIRILTFLTSLLVWPVHAADPKLLDGSPTELGDIEKLINGALNVVLLIGGIVFFAMLLWGGVTLGTSGGSEERVEKGRKILTAAIIGLLIVLFAKPAIVLLIEAFGGSVGP
jgi:hypothetical protein